MTQGAGQGPVVRTATLRDFRVPPYAQVPVQSQTPEGREQPPAPQAPPQAHVPQTPPPPQGPPPPPPPPPPPGPPPAPPSRPAPAHPGDAVPEGELPDGYTPTERDLPVIGRGAPVEAVPAPAPDGSPGADGLGPLYVVGDVHGYLDELVAALAAQGLIDAEGRWAARNARLWFLGDFTDRGPDGIGVIDLVMRLSAEAAAAGGYCKALMGNHELLLLGAKRFSDTPVNSGAGTATFQAAWLLNGGQKSDMDRLQDVHLQWMARLDAVVEEDGHLLVHSDTTAYLEYGSTIEDVNETVHEILTRNDADECWDLFRKLTKRFAFRDEAGPQAVRELLSTYGGARIVHGHSPIPYLLGEVGTEEGEDGERPVVEGPHVYADGLAIAMDGGVTMAGKLLVVQLPLPR
ncbi:metallophosphoesterase [Streptomyces sp. NPDC014894]|uniref:metallophosphoesterase n=1 Tax=Streptomyces sp. NPDC014894 TaxID=3364931 RepID=UPI0036F831E6